MLLGPGLMYSANTIFLSLFALVYLLHYSPWLTLVALAPMPVASILVQYFGSLIHTRFERIQSSFSDISAQAQENYSGVRLIRAFVREKSEIGRFEKLNREYIARALRLVQLMGMLWPTLEFVLGISMVITLLAGGHLVIEHRISVGDFIGFNTYMLQLIWPIIAVGWVVNIFQRGTASVTRIHELMEATPVIADSSAVLPLGEEHRLSGDIEFRNLNFSYGETQVLRNVSLMIPAGSSLAIVGPTGSGKTSLVNLIPRLYDAPEGTLFIDGRPVTEFPLAVLRHNIGMVPQETFLFSAKTSARIWPSARPMPPRTNCFVRRRRRTSGWSSKSFRKDLRLWSASAASRFQADRNSAPPSPARYCAVPRSSSSTTRWPAWIPILKSGSSAVYATTRPPRPRFLSRTESPRCATPTKLRF